MNNQKEKLKNNPTYNCIQKHKIPRLSLSLVHFDTFSYNLSMFIFTWYYYILRHYLSIHITKDIMVDFSFLLI